MFDGDNNGDNDSNDKEENNLLTHLAVKGNPVEVHGTSDLHSGKDAFKSLEAKKLQLLSMTTTTDTSATTTWPSWSTL